MSTPLNVKTFRSSWGHEIAYTDEGDGPVVVFSHGLLWSKAMYRPQIDALAADYRCVAWDHPCQGESSDHPGSEVPIDVCYEVGAELIEMLDVGPVHFVGLSMGGFVGMRLAARRPELVKSLVNMNTAGDTEPVANQSKYRRLNWVARLFGVPRFLADRVVPIMVGSTCMTDPANAELRERCTQGMMKNRRRVYRAVNGVIRRPGVMDELARIRAPTLHLAGAEDKAIAMDRARATADAIPGARFEVIPRAGHTSTLENPEAVSAALRSWLDEQEGRG